MNLKRCVECSRQIRPNNTLKKDYPGTLASGARGMCNVCYDKQRLYNRPKPVGTGVKAKATPKMSTYEDREVPVRVYLKPSTYKMLRIAKLDTNLELSKVADMIAAKIGKRYAR